jgi:hypothetical protein
VTRFAGVIGRDLPVMKIAPAALVFGESRLPILIVGQLLGQCDLFLLELLLSRGQLLHVGGNLARLLVELRGAFGHFALLFGALDFVLSELLA